MTRSWWPGGTSKWSTSPDYPDRIKVYTMVEDDGFNERLEKACHNWNECGAKCLLVVTHQGTKFEPGTISVYRDPAGPYGWWDPTGKYGYAVFGGFNGVSDIGHEIGHALGFGHGGVGIMNATINTGHIGRAERLGLIHYYGRR